MTQRSAQRIGKALGPNVRFYQSLGIFAPYLFSTYSTTLLDVLVWPSGMRARRMTRRRRRRGAHLINRTWRRRSKVMTSRHSQQAIRLGLKSCVKLYPWRRNQVWCVRQGLTRFTGLASIIWWKEYISTWLLFWILYCAMYSLVSTHTHRPVILRLSSGHLRCSNYVRKPKHSLLAASTETPAP